MNLQVIKNRIRKVLAYTVTSILFLLIASFLILQIPPVQNAIVTRLLKNFSGTTHFQTSVQSFHLLWFDRIELEGLSVVDPQGNQMIWVKKALVNYSIVELMNGNNINIDGLVLDSATVLLTTIPATDSTTTLNINALIKEINKMSTSGGDGSTPIVHLGEAVINQSTFTYRNLESDSIAHGFDYNHFSLAVDEGELNNFMILGDTIEFNVRTLLLEDQKTKFKINQLSTFFRVSQSSMEFLGLDLHAGKSVISDTVVFTYANQNALLNFLEEVTIDAHLANTIIYPEDLDIFMKGASQLTRPLAIAGDVNGRINKLKIKNMSVAVGKSRLHGNLDMDGLPNLNETFIILNLNHSEFRFDDVDFLFNEKVLTRLRPIGQLDVSGQFLGYPTDFVANGNIRTAIGNIKSDINVKINEENFDKTVYKGRLTMEQFDLGKFLGDTAMFQKINMNGKIQGSGLTKETADFTLNGAIKSVGINGYNYTNIKSNARFASEFFKGTITMDDPNLQFSTTGSIDLREGHRSLQFDINLDTALFYNLHLASQHIFLKTKLNINTVGLSLDSLTGSADFTDFYIQYENQDLRLDTISIVSQREGTNRHLVMNTNLIDFSADGNYRLTSIYDDIRLLLHEITLNIHNDQDEITAYYKEKKNKRPENYKANFKLDINNIKPISKLLALDLLITPNTVLNGQYTSGYTTIFQAYSSIDTLRYNGHYLYHTNAELTASKIADSTSILAMAYVESESQRFGKSIRTKNLISEGIWNKNHVDFQLDIDQQDQPNYVRLKGGVDFLLDSTLLFFKPSTIHLLERDWAFDEANQIAVKNTGWTFTDLALANAGQALQINGEIADDPEKKLNIEVTNLNLQILNVISSEKFTGRLNTTLQLQDFFHSPAVESNLAIDSLTVNGFLVGNIKGENVWHNAQQQFDINVYVDRLQNRIVNLQGYYKPNDEEPLNVSAEFKQANIKILEPFLDELFTNMDGTVTGNFTIKGKLLDPQINGEAAVAKGQLMVAYTKALYQIDGIVGFRPNEIYFKDMNLTDTYKNKAHLNGSIYHDNFFSMRIDISATMANFQVLNTTAKDNTLFYGQGFATGDVSFTGPIAQLTIKSHARTDKNTRIYIPIGGSGSSEKKEFINFVNFTDTTIVAFQSKKKKRNNKISLSGITFDLNLDVTPDAYCEIIIDIKTGDIIRGRGNGDIKIQLDTKGDFNMFGSLEFIEGWYNFTLYDIINKEFEVQKGSRMTWYGDPYAANLDIKASYNQLASLAPLATDPTIANSPDLKRKYPMRVLLSLDGPMLSPQITFDIVAIDLPKVVSSQTNVSPDFLFQSFKNRLDEQGLKKQVFSLIVLRKFSPPESVDFLNSGTVVNSISELLSNQLSYWMSQVDENLEINVDLGTMDQEALNAFQLRFSYTFLNGRLRVTGDGTFGNNTAYATQPGTKNPNSVAGDWNVDYFLTADGKFKVRLYSRTNYNQLATSINNQNYLTTGVSLQHVQSFNEFKDLLNSNRKKNQKSTPVPVPPDNIKLNIEGVKEEDGTH